MCGCAVCGAPGFDRNPGVGKTVPAWEKLSPGTVLPTSPPWWGLSLSTRISEPSKGSPPRVVICLFYMWGCVGGCVIDTPPTQSPCGCCPFGGSQAGWRLLRHPAQQFFGNTEETEDITRYE